MMKTARQAVLRFCLIGCMALLCCTKPPRSTILVQMIKAQEEFFANEVIPGYDKENNAVTDVVHYAHTDSLEADLKKYAGRAALVKIPFVNAPNLINRGLLLPLENVLSQKELNDYRATFILTSLGMSGGKHYCIPRKYETRIMVYCKSKVADALAVWRSCRDSISAELKKMNGYGLPATYILEDDPDKWDFFDIYAVGWIWAHTPYDNKTGCRIAHRGKRYSGTSQRIIDRIFQCGGDSTAVLTMRGPAVTDAMMWEAVYAASVYNKKMWEEAWSGVDLWKGFRDGEVFLAFMTQLDCFFIHGTGQDGLDGFLSDPSDMGVALMPQGRSVILDNVGNALREGTRTVTTGGWWWGIPSDAPDPKASYRLARYIIDTKAQINDCNRFGMIPVRKDILSDIPLLFGGGWVTEIYEKSFKQLMNNSMTTLPANAHIDDIGNLYLDAWYDIVVNRNWSASGSYPQWDYIRQVLESMYVPRALQQLGR